MTKVVLVKTNLIFSFIFVSKTTVLRSSVKDWNDGLVLLDVLYVKQYPILFIELEFWWAKKAKKSVWFPCSFDPQTRNSLSSPDWLFLKTSLLKQPCQSLASFWKWFGVCGVWMTSLLCASMTKNTAVLLHFWFLSRYKTPNFFGFSSFFILKRKNCDELIWSSSSKNTLFRQTIKNFVEETSLNFRRLQSVSKVFA